MVALTELFWFATAVKVVGLLLGGSIVYLAYKGYRRNGMRSLLYVAFGFLLITIGTLIEGVLYVLLESPLLSATTVGTTVTIIGFATILYSIYVSK